MVGRPAGQPHAAFNSAKFICQTFLSSNNVASGVVSILDLIVGSAPGQFGILIVWMYGTLDLKKCHVWLVFIG